MASISSDSNGNRTIQFIGTDGKRRSIRLGKIHMADARDFKRNIEAIHVAGLQGKPLQREQAEWLSRLEDVLYKRIVAVGLAEPRAPKLPVQLGAFLDSYIAGRTDVKERTTWNLEIVARRMKEHFGGTRTLESVTPADADAFAIWLKGKYAEATAARSITRARQFFAAAIRARLIFENPFATVKPGKMSNPDRAAFISREVIAKVSEACPSAEWRLIVALARFAGLRCPSEFYTLDWADVLWEQERIVIKETKTKARVIPLFPELRGPLSECFEHAKDGALRVIVNQSIDGAGLRKGLRGIIHKAGLAPWPKLFHNLRASRQTELEADFPTHVVCAWLGNSKQVAEEHYLQVRDEDFARAILGKAVQKAVQASILYRPLVTGNARNDSAETLKTANFQRFQPIGFGPEYPRQDSNLRPAD